MGKFWLYYTGLFLILSITNVLTVGLTDSNYLNYEYTTIYNIQNNCRYCKTFESNTKISFNQCSFLRYDKQRFFILRGKGNCNTYTIMNALNADNLLSYQNNQDFEIVNVNASGGVVIKVPNQNLCMTNNLTDNLVFPYEVVENQLFTPCATYNTDEKQVFYFWPYIIEPFNTHMCRTETTSYLTLNFFETSKAVYVDSGLVADNTNINIGGPFSYDFNVQTLNTGSFSMFIEFGSYTVNLTLKDTHFYIYNPFVITPSTNITPAIDINITEKINNVTFSISDFFTSLPLTTDKFVTGSNIVFTNTYDLVDWTYVVVAGNTTFQIWLRWGTYTNIQSTQIALWEQVSASFSIVISSFGDTSFTLVIDQKVLVTFTMINDVTSAGVTTSTFQTSTNIGFTRVLTSVVNNYPVGSGAESTFQIYLFFGTHNLSSSDHNEWTRMTSSINITGPGDNAFNIRMKEKTAPCRFYFQVQNLSNANSDTCLFANGSNIDFINTIPRTVTMTVPGGCVSYFDFDLFLGTWSINTYTLSNSTLYHMYLITGQTFVVGDYTAKTFYIKFNKMFEKALYQYINLTGSPETTYQNVHGLSFDCGSNYVLTYFASLARFNNGMNFWIFCKQIKDNIITIADTGFQISGPTNQTIFFFDRQNVNCSNTQGIQRFYHEVSGTDIKTTYTCIDLPTPVDPGCTSIFGFISPDSSSGSMLNFHNRSYGSANSVLRQVYIHNDNWTGVGTFYSTCKFYNMNPPNNVILGTAFSYSFPNSFKNLAQNNTTCDPGYGMIFYTHAVHGSVHDNIFFCKALEAGYYSNLQTMYTPWNITGGDIFDFYDRHDADCGSSRVIKSRNLEFDDGTQNIRIRYECYDYTFPNQLSSLIHLKGDCSQTQAIFMINGFTYGDGANFLNRMKMEKSIGGTFYNCGTYYNVLLPLR